jgi:flagellar hook-associated protein 2
MSTTTSTTGTLNVGTSNSAFVLTGLASGYDWSPLVDALTDVARAQETLLQTQQDTIQQRNIAYGSLVTELGVLKNKADALNEPTLFDSRTAQVADPTIASASAASGTALGTYTFAITQLATAASQQGTTNVGAALSATNDVSGLVLSDAAFANNVTAGAFTVNGQAVTIATSDTLQQVFDKISSATAGAVTGSYNATTDKITLSSTNPIVLGSAADTSNFLQVAQLYNNGTGTVASASSLGVVKLGAALNAANFATPISDGGSGAGAFTINGVTINFNASTDSLATIISRINDSAAGVTAAYDPINDGLTLTDKTTGDVGIALQDVTGKGNFLAATGLSGGTLQRGTNLHYTVNGGGQLISQSNTITQDSSGVPGLSVTALKEDTTTVTVGSDTAKIKSALSDFITEYNKVQSVIGTQTASSTDDKGNVTAGVLAGDQDIAAVTWQLRSLAYSPISGLSGSINQLAALGYATNGNDNTITLSDSTALDNALANNLSSVKDLFTNADVGLAATLSSYLDKTAGDNGTLVAHQNVLTQQSTDLDTQIAAQEWLVQAQRQRLIDSFVAMETAQSLINQQLTFLSQQTWGSSSSG